MKEQAQPYDSPDEARPSSPRPPTLEYGTLSRGRLWRRRMLRAAIPLFIIAIAITGFWYRQDISLRVRRIYWFHQCMVHVTPPGTVLLEQDPLKAKSLLVSNPAYVEPKKWQMRWVPGQTRQLTRQNQQVDSRQTPLLAEYIPKPMRELDAFVPFMLMQRSDEAVVFLGERRIPSGAKRLVLISGALHNAFALELELKCSALVIIPPSTWGSPPQIAGPQRALQWSGRAIPVLLSPGVGDTLDMTHISIPYMIDLSGSSRPNRSGTIDVYLRQDEHLDFIFRDPATTQAL